MNKIPINQIHPSPNPIRKTWDEDKMDELAQSIRERGVIVPIKVRPNADGYEIVYGHRRVEAGRRAGLLEMPVIVEGVDDTEALIQALIENVQREDMEPMDKAIALKRLKDLRGWNNLDLDRNGIIEQSYASRLVALLDESQEVQELVGRVKSGPKSTDFDQIKTISEMHVAKVRASGLDVDERRDVLMKTAEEQLTRDEARAVADAYAAADTPELKQAVLETSGKLGSAENILRVAEVKLANRHVADVKEHQRERAFQEFDTAVKDFLDSIRMFNRMIMAAKNAAKYGKFSPEAKPFTIRKIDELIDELEALREVLS